MRGGKVMNYNTNTETGKNISSKSIKESFRYWTWMALSPDERLIVLQELANYQYEKLSGGQAKTDDKPHSLKIEPKKFEGLVTGQYDVMVNLKTAAFVSMKI